MRRGALAALAVVLVGGAVGVAKLRSRASARRPAPASPWPAIDPERVSGLEIINGEHVIRLKRHLGDWLIVAPLHDRADGAAVARALRALKRIEIAPTPIASGRSTWPRYEVADREVLTLRVREAGVPVPPLHLGRSRFARVGDRPQVYEVSRLRRDTFDQALRMWRDRTVLSLTAPAVTGLEVIDAAGDRVAATRLRAKAGPGPTHPSHRWKLTEGKKLASPFDPSVPARLLRRLLTLRADNIDDDVAFKGAGLDHPVLTIVIHTTSGEQQLAFGKRSDGMTPIGIVGRKRVWLLGPHTTAELVRGPRQWRDKTLIDVRAAEIRRVSLTEGGRTLELDRDTGWVAKRPPGFPLNAEAADDYAGALSHVEASAVAAPGAAFTGTISTVAVSTGGAKPSAVTLTLAERDDGTFLVKSSRRPDVLVLDPRVARSLAPTIDSFRRR